MSRLIGTLLAVLALVALPAGPAARSAEGSPPGLQRAPVILVFGDSLSAGYGVPLGHGWVSLLARKIASEGYDFEVVNASVTGETTAGGRARLPAALSRYRPRLLILELGANDGLRGLPVAGAEANLEAMISLAQAQHARVLLLGVRMPPNYGPRYTSEFSRMYADLAHRRHVALVPFLLEGIALHPALMQQDGLHPNEQGQPLLLDNVWPALAPLLRQAGARAAAR